MIPGLEERLMGEGGDEEVMIIAELVRPSIVYNEFLSTSSLLKIDTERRIWCKV
jgi:hypothetical protein